MKCSKCGNPSFISPCRPCLIEELRRLRGGLIIAIILIAALLTPMAQAVTPQPAAKIQPATLEQALDYSLAYGYDSIEWSTVDAGNSWGT